MFSWRWKLFLIFVIISVTPLIIFYFTMLMFINISYIDNKKASLLGHAEALASGISRNGLPHTSTISYITNETSHGLRILVVDYAGLVLQDSAGSYNGRILEIPEVANAIERGSVASTRQDEQKIYAASAIGHENGYTAAVLLVASIENISNSVQMNQPAIMFTLIVIIIMTALSLVISGLVLAPLNNFLRVVSMAAEGRFEERIELKGQDEFTRLGQAFNNMAERLAQSESSRDEFVSNVSHELKTPLSSIKVLTESILIMEIVPRRMYNEFLKDINSEVDRMTNIVNGLLNLVKLDQREMALSLAPTNISRLVEDILKRLSPLARQKKLALIYENMRSVTTLADEMKLTLAISNVVENAIKYTNPYGTISVRVDSDHQFAFINVTDTGIGIAEEDQAKVFSRFYRADKTRNRETGGTGLGLAISHSTMLMHGGSIRLSSKEGEGSTFFIRLPMRRQ